jgi:hypothetical protein
MTLDLLVEGRIATLAGQTGFGWVEAAVEEPTLPGGVLSTARPRLVLEAGKVAFEH